MRHYDPIVKEHFHFKPKDGGYLVMYRTEVKNLTWIAHVTDMTVIDKVMNNPDPTVKELKELRNHVKAHGHRHEPFLANEFKRI